MTDADDFMKFIKDFLKRPILPKQEAAILCAYIDGTLNKQGAIEVMRIVMSENIKKHNEFMNMSSEEILALCERYKNVETV